jgi:aspartate ammonia-lyase
MEYRIEKDYLGEKKVPAEAYYGIHTLRALENFPFSGYKLDTVFIKSMAEVKLAAFQINLKLGYIDPSISKAIEKAIEEIRNGKLHKYILVDAFQGGAGTSTNMNFNEVIANRALEILGHKKGEYHIISPIEHINLHQSTNDVYPTALKVAVLYYLKDLEIEIAKIQEILQKKEQEYKNIVKLGRTQLRDAVPLTVGMSFGAWAEAIARDRWRIFKSRERIKVVNLGGTAIGNGISAPRDYILRVVNQLREITGLNLARSENLLETTQNMDTLIEVSGMLKTYGVNLLKISNDIRLLGSGPEGGIGELIIPPQQVGSSIMPGKINPVILEAVSQVALTVINNDNLLSQLAGWGNLELNQFMPLLNHTICETLRLLLNASKIFASKCLSELKPALENCQKHLEKSLTLATILIPLIGYKKVEKLVKKSKEKKKTLKETLLEENFLTSFEIEELLSPKRMYKLGFNKRELEIYKEKFKDL